MLAFFMISYFNFNLISWKSQGKHKAEWQFVASERIDAVKICPVIKVLYFALNIAEMQLL